MTPEAQAATTGEQVTLLEEAVEGRKCRFSNIVKGSSGKRSKKTCAKVPSNTITVGDFNTSLTSMDRPTIQTNKETIALNETLDQMDSRYTQNTPYKSSRIHIILGANGTFSRINHIFGTKQ